MYIEKRKLVVTYYEAFAGFGASSLALEMVQNMLPGIKFKCVGHCECDPIANTAYKNIHGDVPLDDDITTADFTKLPTVDFLSWTAPCTALSAAGKQHGFEEGSGTASALIWEIRRFLEAQKPAIIFFENVKDIETRKKFKSTWIKFKEYLESEGYHLNYKVVDSAKHDWPQHRERFMMIATLADIKFAFPEEVPLKFTMNKLLEKDNNEKIRYKRTINSFIYKALGEGRYRDRPARGFTNMRIHSLNDATMAYTITTRPLRITENFIWDTDINMPNGFIRVNQNNLDAADLTIEDLYNAPIRRLSTSETMRLMGLPSKYHNCFDGIKMTNIYKLMGNSIVIPTLRDVLYEFFKAMLEQKKKLKIK